MYRITLDEHVVKNDIPALPKHVKAQMQKAFAERLMTAPLLYGKPLRHEYKGYRRLRIGKYRIIYKVDEAKKEVFVIAIDHRKDIYN